MGTRLKIVAVLGLVLVLGGAGYLAGAHLSGGAWPTLGLPLGGELGVLRHTSRDFVEDLQFKDFDKAATYHDPDVQDQVDIPFLLERLFLQKPELIDIVDYEVVTAHLDSTGDRARVRMRVQIKDLALETARNQEFMLYYHRDGAGQPWRMELESSLRRIEAEDGKRH